MQSVGAPISDPLIHEDQRGQTVLTDEDNSHIFSFPSPPHISPLSLAQQSQAHTGVYTHTSLPWFMSHTYGCEAAEADERNQAEL